MATSPTAASTVTPASTKPKWPKSPNENPCNLKKKDVIQNELHPSFYKPSYFQTIFFYDTSPNMSITFPTFSKLSQCQGQAPPPPRPFHQQSKVNKSSLISQPGAPSIPKSNNTPPVRHQREGCAEGTPLCVPFAKHHLIIVPVFS